MLYFLVLHVCYVIRPRLTAVLYDTTRAPFCSGGGCRHQSGQVAWEEFVKLFELIDDQTTEGGCAALNPDLKEVSHCCERL